MYLAYWSLSKQPKLIIKLKEEISMNRLLNIQYFHLGDNIIYTTDTTEFEIDYEVNLYENII